MSHFVHTVGTVGGAALGLDAADPNAAAPTAARQFGAPIDDVALNGVQLAICPRGGTTITIQLWVFEPSGDAAGRWYKVGAATACPTDTLTPIVQLAPRGGRMYAQITANTNVTYFGVMPLTGTRT